MTSTPVSAVCALMPDARMSSHPFATVASYVLVVEQLACAAARGAPIAAARSLIGLIARGC